MIDTQQYPTAPWTTIAAKPRHRIDPPVIWNVPKFISNHPNRLFRFYELNRKARQGQFGFVQNVC